MDNEEILRKLIVIEGHVKRILADKESEKDTRRIRNRAIDFEIGKLKDAQVKLEKRQDKQDYLIWAVGLICIAIGWIAKSFFK